MVYEDALTVLSYASPYPVVLTLRKAAPLLSGDDGDPGSMSGLNHPIYRSQSLDDLRKITRADRASGPRKTWTQIRRREKSESRAQEIGKLREWSANRSTDDDVTDAPAQLEVDAPVEKVVVAEVMEAQTQAQVEREVRMFDDDDVTPHPTLPSSHPPLDHLTSFEQMPQQKVQQISAEVHAPTTSGDLENDRDLLKPIRIGDLEIEPPREFLAEAEEEEVSQRYQQLANIEETVEDEIIPTNRTTSQTPADDVAPDVNESSFPEVNTTLDLDLSTQANVTDLSYVDKRMLDLDISETSKPISEKHDVTSHDVNGEEVTAGSDDKTAEEHQDLEPLPHDVTLSATDVSTSSADATVSSAHDDAVRDVLKEFLGDDPSLLASFGIDTSVTSDLNDNQLKHVTALNDVDDVTFETRETEVRAASDRAAEQLRAAQDEMNGK